MAGFRSLFPLSLISAGLIASPFLWPILFPLTWLALIPFLTALERARDWRQALWTGALTGMVTIALGFYWLVYTIHVFGGVNYALAAVVFILFVLYSAIPFVAFAGLVRLCGVGPLGLFPPTFWVAVEFWFPNLFPWYLATGQTRFTYLNQSADLVGHYGAAFILLWCGAALHILYKVLRARRREETMRSAAWAVGAACAVLAAAVVYGQVRTAQVDSAARAAAKLDVAVIQGNVAIERKGRAAFLKTNQETYQKLSERHPDADLVIWPESAMENWLPNGARRIPRDLLPARHPHMIVGAISYQHRPGNRFRKYNSAVAVDPAGAVSGRYHKRVLMAFGEYIPLAWLIGAVPGMPPIGDSFTPGEIESPFVLPQGARVAPLICYEDLMADLSRRFVRNERANLLVNLTNDAWYGRTAAPWQHARMARWRSIETRRAMVRATNTGVTTVIDPAGRMAAALPLFTEGVLRATVPLMELETVYVRYGDWFAWLMTLTTAAVAGRGLKRPADSWTGS